jgi:hypothetical protein
MTGLVVGGLGLSFTPSFGTATAIADDVVLRDLVRNGSFEVDEPGRSISSWTVFESGGK